MMTPATEPKRPFRRAADLTAMRLGRAILGYLAVVMLVITLAPFRFDTHPVHGLTDLWDWSDIVMNVVMFLPIGFVYQLTRPAGSPVRWWRVTLLGAVLSGTIETAQLFEAARYTSLVDVVTNTAGAVIGAWIYGVALRRLDGKSTVRTMALELPLMGLVYLLVPLQWLVLLAGGRTNAVGDDASSRGWLALLIVVFASGIIGSIFTAYLAPARQLARGWLVVAVSGWTMVALLPGAIRDRELLLAGLAIAIGVAWLRSIATFRDQRRNTPSPTISRFELPTLRLLMPCFAAYLAMSSLWPLDGAELEWHAMWPLLHSLQAEQREIFAALEHIASFTLVGYIIAEFHGRDLERYRDIAGRVIVWGGGLSVLFEFVRGFFPIYQASASMLVLTIGAAMFGGRLYQLQRDHVRALLARRTRSPWPASRPEHVVSPDVVANESDRVEPVLSVP